MDAPKLSLNDIGFDIESINQDIINQNTTDISDRIKDDVVKPVKFESAKFTELQQKVKQVYIIDVTNCETLTESWVNGLHNLVLCTELDTFNGDEINLKRSEMHLTDLIPDTALSLKIKSNGEDKILFIGYMDACQAYEILKYYVNYCKDASLYWEINGVLKEVRDNDSNGLRVRV